MWFRIDEGKDLRPNGASNDIIRALSSRQKEIRMSEVSESEFKGNPMMVIKSTPDDKFPFQFGVKKAKLVLAHVEDIKKFVEKHDR